MKKLILVLALTMASQAQAETPVSVQDLMENTTLENCRNATNDISFIYAYNAVCPSGVNAESTLNYQMGMFKLKGCTKKVSLNDIRLAISRDIESLTQMKYQTNDPNFCISDKVIKERDAAYSDLLNKSLR